MILRNTIESLRATIVSLMFAGIESAITPDEWANFSRFSGGRLPRDGTDDAETV